jgi:hypothetical protein
LAELNNDLTEGDASSSDEEDSQVFTLETPDSSSPPSPLPAQFGSKGQLKRTNSLPRPALLQLPPPAGVAGKPLPPPKVTLEPPLPWSHFKPIPDLDSGSSVAPTPSPSPAPSFSPAPRPSISAPTTPIASASPLIKKPSFRSIDPRGSASVFEITADESLSPVTSPSVSASASASPPSPASPRQPTDATPADTPQQQQQQQQKPPPPEDQQDQQAPQQQRNHNNQAVDDTDSNARAKLVKAVSAALIAVDPTAATDSTSALQSPSRDDSSASPSTPKPPGARPVVPPVNKPEKNGTENQALQESDVAAPTTDKPPAKPKNQRVCQRL